MKMRWEMSIVRWFMQVLEWNPSEKPTRNQAKEGWPLISGSLAWTYEGKGFRKRREVIVKEE